MRGLRTACARVKAAACADEHERCDRPTPVSVAQRLVEDSFMKVVLVDGTDVLAASHPGRTIPARMRTAVEELHPECDVEGCHISVARSPRGPPPARI